MPIRVAVAASHPIQYQVPLWRRLGARAELDVKVFYGCDMSVRGYRDEGFGSQVRWDVSLLEGYEFEFLSTDPSIQSVGFLRPSGRGIRHSLAQFNPDTVLLTAYNSVFHLSALRAARRLRAKVVMRHEASDVAVSRHPLKARIRDWVLRRVYSRVDRFAAIGVNARRHILRLGVPENRVGRSPYCVDTGNFASQRGTWQPKRALLRAESGIAANQVAFLFSGKLTPKKDPLILARALDELPREVLDRVHVMVAGDGELRGVLQDALRRRIADRVHFLGFLNQSEIGRAYTAADVLVLPSKQGAGETWGLVVNEALQFGLPAIVSDAVGCHPDLVITSETGWTFPAGDALALGKRIWHFALLEIAERTRLSEAAIKHVAGYSLEAAADGLARELLATAER